MEVANVEEVIMFYYDSSLNAGEPRQDWVATMIKDDSNYWETQIQACRDYQIQFKANTESFKPNQTKDAQIIQEIMGCQVDDDTKKVTGTKRFAYNGEDFLSFDMNNNRWNALHPRAEAIKERWDTYNAEHQEIKSFVFTICPLWLKTYLTYGNATLHRKDLPSVSLLQRTPSSPVSCHATGFYPDRAVIFWRKDGEEIHEGVEHGEILPNPDNSFQMSVDLNVSKLPFKEWEKYSCVFQLSGVQNDLIIRLDKGVIRTNWIESDENLSVTSIAVISTMAVLAVLIVTVIASTAYKKKNERSPGSSNETLQREE